MQLTGKTKIVLLAVAAAAAAYVAGGYGERGEEAVPLPNENYRIPTERPPVEPDRPDLFEEQGLPDDAP